MAATPEELSERVQQWVQPLSEAAPAGTNAQFDARHETVRNEVGKLDAPSGGAINWNMVIDTAGEILTQTSKDLLMGAYVAYGLYQVKGIDGLVTGLTLLTELTDRFWESLFPELRRIRGRANALAWFIDRVNIGLPNTQISASLRGPIQDLAVAAKRFGSVVRTRFEDNAPAVSGLAENAERLIMSLPPEAPPPPPPPPPQAAAPAPAPAAASAPAAAAPAAAPAAAGPALAAPPKAELGADAGAFLREVGTSLIGAGNTLRRGEIGHSQAYRVFRVGLWLHLSDAPPAGPGGKTQIPPLAPALRAKLDQMAGSGAWAPLVEESESAMPTARFALDLHRYSAQGLAALGHAKSRQGVLDELGHLLRRFPQILDYQAADGSPLADAQTKAWIEAEVTPAGQGGGGAAADWLDEARGEARKLVGAGKVAEAVELLHGKVGEAASGKERFRARLLLARACGAAGQSGVARALFEALDREIAERGLEEWEPALAAESLEGHVQAVRALAKGKPPPPEAAALYDRLCRLDPTMALKLGP